MAAATVALTFAALTVSVAGGPGNPRDWVGLFAVGADHSTSEDWCYLANGRKSPKPTSGVTSGTVILSAPTDEDGAYEVRFLSASAVSNYVLLATSKPLRLGAAPVTIVLSSPPGVTAAKTPGGGYSFTDPATGATYAVKP